MKNKKKYQAILKRMKPHSIANNPTPKRQRRRLSKGQWLSIAGIGIPAVVSLVAYLITERGQNKRQEKAHDYKKDEINQTSNRKIMELDRDHQNKMEEKDLDHSNAIDKLEAEYDIWQRKEEYRDNQAERKRSEYDYDRPTQTFSEIVNRPDAINKFEYIADTPLTVGDFCTIYSSPGDGKSVLLNQILLGASLGQSTGLDCYDSGTYKPMYTLLYDAEQTEEDMQVRYPNNQNKVINRVPPEHCDFRGDPFLLIKDIERKIFKKKADCMVGIDNTSKMFPTISAKVVTDTINALEALQAKAKVEGFTLTIILVTHAVKNPKSKREMSNMSGSANWSRFGKTIISLTSMDDDNYKIMKIEKNRRGKKGEEFVLRLEFAPFYHFVNDVSAAETHHQNTPDVIPKDWPRTIRGVNIKLALEIAAAHKLHKKGSGYGCVFEQFKGRQGVRNEKQIERIIKQIKKLKEKEELASS